MSKEARTSQSNHSSPEAELASLLLDIDNGDELLRPSDDDMALESLREILFGSYRQKVSEQQSELDNLNRILEVMEDQINDTDQLIATIKPVMADTLSATIRD